MRQCLPPKRPWIAGVSVRLWSAPRIASGPGLARDGALASERGRGRRTAGLGPDKLRPPTNFRGG